MIVRVPCPECRRVGQIEVDALFDTVAATCSCGEVIAVTVDFGQVRIDGEVVPTVVAP